MLERVNEKPEYFPILVLWTLTVVILYECISQKPYSNFDAPILTLLQSHALLRPKPSKLNPLPSGSYAKNSATNKHPKLLTLQVRSHMGGC